MQKQQSQMVYSVSRLNKSYPGGPVSFHGDFSEQECEKIIEIGESLKKENSGINVENKETSDKNVRDSIISWITPTEEYIWIFEKIKQIVVTTNDQFFGFDLYGFYDSIQFTRYEAPSGKYNKHMDTSVNPNEQICRKLSITIQLSDPNDYEGGDLLVYTSSKKTPTNKKRGIITIFPSFMLHEVTPVTKGTRYSLVTWISGPAFR